MNNIFIIHFLSIDEAKIPLTRENMWESKNTFRIRKEQCYCYDREREQIILMGKRIVLLLREREINYDGKVFSWCVKYALTMTNEANL